MVHALKEARRVVKPGGLVIDLRPTPTLRHVGILRRGNWKGVGLMHECLDLDHAADRAVREVLRRGSLKLTARTAFVCDRVIDTVPEFKSWLEEFLRPAELRGVQPMLARVSREMASRDAGEQIIVRGPLRLQVFEKS